MGAIVIRTRYDEGTESAEVATSERNTAWSQSGKGDNLNLRKKYDMKSVR